MDPNANLRRQDYILDVTLTVSHPLWYRKQVYKELKKLRSELQKWLSGGGSTPDWSEYPKASKFFKH